MSAIQAVTIEFSCPNCGADGYEQEMDADDIAQAVQVSFRCDECPATIHVDADVRIQASEAPREQRIEAAEDRAEQVAYDAWRERGL